MRFNWDKISNILPGMVTLYLKYLLKIINNNVSSKIDICKNSGSKPEYQHLVQQHSKKEKQN